MVKIAVDCMGGDSGLDVTLPASRAFLNAHSDAHLLLIGDQEAISRRWDAHPRAQIVHASEVVTMEDSVEIALRKKKDSSIRVAVTQVKEGLADAALSAGNTGALMAIARYVLKTLDGIDRPAIAAQIPNAKGRATTMLDLGANVDCTPSHLLQFAVMGSALVSCLGEVESPSVGLLNVGEEIIKGNDTIKQAGELLRQASASGDLNFYGNIEGDDIFKGTTDIVVCDGFVGNVSLKTSEGLAAMIGTFLKEEFNRSLLSKMAAVCAQHVLKSFKSKVDHRKYNGAALLGLRGLVFKSHGSADAWAFESALKKVYDAADKRLLERLQVRIAHAEPLLLSLDFSKT